MGVAASNSQPHGPPKCLVEPGSCAKQGTVASHLNIANSALPPKTYILQESAGKGLSLSNCGRPRASRMFPRTSSPSIVFLWEHILPDCSASARLTPIWDASGQKETDLCRHHRYLPPTSKQVKTSPGCPYSIFSCFLHVLPGTSRSSKDPAHKVPMAPEATRRGPITSTPSTSTIQVPTVPSTLQPTGRYENTPRDALSLSSFPPHPEKSRHLLAS